MNGTSATEVGFFVLVCIDGLSHLAVSVAIFPEGAPQCFIVQSESIVA